MEYCGIDLHDRNSEICILDENGEVMERTRVTTTRTALRRFFSRRPPMRVAMEACGFSPWVSRLVAKCDHEVVVCNARRVRLIAESTLKNDKVDAEVLARLVRIDPEFLRPIQHRSEEAQRLRAKLLVRRSLVDARTGWINRVRGILRGFGYRVAGKNADTFVERVDLMKLPAELREVVEPLLEQIDLVSGEIERRNEDLEEVAARIPEVAHLSEIPGVGLIVALFFVLTIDDPGRFPKSRDVGAFLGLRPSMRESAASTKYGRITKEGDSEMRRLLVQAAHGMMNTKKDCALKQWATAVAARRGKSKAAVALGRKLGVLMHHLWVTGEPFVAFPEQRTADLQATA
jgi:transposase